MTSLLEKACAAVYALAPIGVRSWEDCPVAEANAIRAQVRAVLGAVRDLDHDATAAVVKPGDDRTKAVRDFQAIIDAILAEGKA